MKLKVLLSLLVLRSFADKTDLDKKFKPKEVLKTSDLDRVNDLIARGLCVLVDVKEDEDEDGKGKIVAFGSEMDLGVVKDALKEIGSGVNWNSTAETVGKKIEGLTEEQKASLIAILVPEK